MEWNLSLFVSPISSGPGAGWKSPRTARATARRCFHLTLCGACADRRVRCEDRPQSDPGEGILGGHASLSRPQKDKLRCGLQVLRQIPGPRPGKPTIPFLFGHDYFVIVVERMRCPQIDPFRATQPIVAHALSRPKPLTRRRRQPGTRKT